MLTLDLDALALKPGDLCLDIGCGEGRHSLAAYCLPDVHAVGIDLSETALATATERTSDMQCHAPQGEIGFGVGDDLIGDAAEFFGFGEGGDDSFVVDEGCYHVAQHGRGLNRERSFCASIIPAAQDLARSFIVTLIFFRRDISQSSILPTAFTGFANGMTS